MAYGAEAPTVKAFTIITSQFEPMVTFYRDVMGFELESADGGFAVFRDTALSIADEQTMADASGHDGFLLERRGRGFEIAFEVSTPEDVDRVYARLLAAGARAVAPPTDQPWGQRMAFFADPDGNVHDVFATIPPTQASGTQASGAVK